MPDWRRHIIVAIMLGACCSLAPRLSLAEEIPQKIASEEARKLALLATGEVSLEYDGPSKYDQFFVFEALGPEAGSSFFKVNPWTGDVWDEWGCKKLSTPGLRKLQAKIRKRFTKDELKEYQKLRKIRPECVTD